MKLIKSTKYKYGFYSNIKELPIFNWYMFYDTNDYSYLLHDGPRQLTPKETEHLKKVFDKIIDEFTDVFGVSEKYAKMLQIQKRIAIIEAGLVFTPGKYIRTDLRYEQLLLQRLMEDEDSKKPVSFMELKVAAQKWLGSHIPEKECSVEEFYTTLKLMKEASERANMEAIKRSNKKGQM